MDLWRPRLTQCPSKLKMKLKFKLGLPIKLLIGKSNVREACKLKNVPKSGKGPRGGDEHQKSKGPQFQMWTFS